MAVKWIGEVASDMGISTLDAVELLAARGEYPFNGFLDDDRIFLLKRAAQERKGPDASGVLHRPVVPTGPPAPPLAPPASPFSTNIAPPAPVQPASRSAPGEKTSVTTAIPTGRPAPPAPPPPPPSIGKPRDGADERTVIIPAPGNEP